jgi:hypothetical protein
MATWTKETWNEKNKIGFNDIIIIGEYRFQYKLYWIKLEDGDSHDTHRALKDLLGDDWKDLIYGNFEHEITTAKADFTYSPSITTEETHKKFITFLMAYGDVYKNKPRTWNKYNFHDCIELKDEDIINFGDNIKYEVRTSFLCIISAGSNDIILEKTYGESYKQELSLLYGYEVGGGDWPVCSDGDYKALTRAMKNIFQCLYFGQDKPSRNAMFHPHSVPPVECTISSEVQCVNLNDEPKLINSQVKISKITNVDALDKIKLL